MKKSNGAKKTTSKKSNGKVRGGNAHERDRAWHASAKAKAEVNPPLEPGQARCTLCEWSGPTADARAANEGGAPACPECASLAPALEVGPEPEPAPGVMLSKGTDFEVNEPMNEAELRIAKGNAIGAHGALVAAERMVEIAKKELKAAKESEESCRAAWDELAMRIAEGVKKVKVRCRVFLEHDGKVRAYRIDTGELVDTRDPTKDEIKQADKARAEAHEKHVRPELPFDGEGADSDATPGPGRVVEYDEPDLDEPDDQLLAAGLSNLDDRSAEGDAAGAP